MPLQTHWEVKGQYAQFPAIRSSIQAFATAAPPSTAFRFTLTTRIRLSSRMLTICAIFWFDNPNERRYTVSRWLSCVGWVASRIILLGPQDIVDCPDLGNARTGNMPIREVWTFMLEQMRPISPLSAFPLCS